MVDLMNIVICFFFLAIPETFFMVILLIKFMGRRELLDIYRIRENIKWYIILVIPPSLLISILLYGFKIQRSTATSISMITLYLLFIYVFEKTKIEESKYLAIKILFRFIPLYISLIAIDLLTTPIIFYFIHSTYQEMYKNIYLVLLFSLASRVIEFTIIIFTVTYKQRKFQINLFEYAYSNNFFRRFVIIAVIALLIFEMCVLKLILCNNLLSVLHSLTGQILFVIGVVYLIPSLVIIGIYLLISNCVSINLNSVKQEHSSNKEDVSV